MRTFEIRLERTQSVLAGEAHLADSPWPRMKGLLGRRSLDPGEALILRPCWSVHTWFMRFALDVVYLDKDDRVAKVVVDLKPWRFSASRGAKTAIEFPSRSLAAESIQVGDRLILTERSAIEDDAPNIAVP